MRILIVRLGALGDIVHAVPAAAALRRALPGARIDWVVDAKHAGFVGLVDAVDRVIALHGRSAAAWLRLLRTLRAARYDAALDFQGLLKSAALARFSGARRAVGFPAAHLRERTARPFYSAVHGPDGPAHVIQKNLRLLAGVGVESTGVEFPLKRAGSAAWDQVKHGTGGRPVALVNPGAAWPNKRWAPERYGEVCSFLDRAHGMRPYVLWGAGEEPLARRVVEVSGGAAHLSPPTTTADLLEISREAALIVSGDTGPLHIAAAAGTPAVAIFGPTDPARNGPWSPEDVVISRYPQCACHYARRCRQPSRWCLADVPVAEVTGAIDRRLAHGRPVDSVR